MLDYPLLFLLLGAVQARNICRHGDVRLTTTSTDQSTASIHSEGKAEVCTNGVRWLPVCSSSRTVPNLICRQLGFSGGGYWSRPVRASSTRSVVFICDGGEHSLISCNHYVTQGRCQQVRIRCEEHKNETIPEILSLIDDGATSVSLRWNLEERDELANFVVECSSVSHFARLIVNNQTFTAKVQGLISHTKYSCCVSAMFDNYKTQSCAYTDTGITAVQTSSGLASARNADTVGGVLGLFIIIFLLLLILAILALVYPCLIRPRIRDHRALIRLSDFLDRKIYNNIYGLNLSPTSFTREERLTRSTSTGARVRTSSSTYASAGRRTESIPIPKCSSIAQNQYEALSHYSSVESHEQLPAEVNKCVAGGTSVQHEPAAYSLPISTSLGQGSADPNDHVYAVLEKMIN